MEWLAAGSEAVCVTMKRSVTQAQTMCTGIFQHLSSVAGQGTTHKLWGGGCWRKGEGPQVLLQSPGWKDLGQCFLYYGPRTVLDAKCTQSLRSVEPANGDKRAPKYVTGDPGVVSSMWKSVSHKRLNSRRLRI